MGSQNFGDYAPTETLHLHKPCDLRVEEKEMLRSPLHLITLGVSGRETLPETEVFMGVMKSGILFYVHSCG